MPAQNRKVLTGKVVSAKMQKTIVVQVERKLRHPKYRRVVRRYSKFKVHDQNGQAKPGDAVKIIETRPLSKEKRWMLVEVINPLTHPRLKSRDIRSE